MKRLNWQIRLGLVLVALSVLLYAMEIAVFRRSSDTLFYFVQDLAFIPLQVLLVTLILHQILALRERRALLRKLNMVIGTFYSEVGTPLLRRVAALDANSGELTRALAVTGEWRDADFRSVSRKLKEYRSDLRIEPQGLHELKESAVAKQAFLLALLQNPNLLEHDAFTELLWAVFHVSEEFAHRSDVFRLPESDRQHLSGDVRRAYHALIDQWIDHMNHLRVHYPYLFSLAMRTNPFQPDARVEVGT